jgi:hypothetical protein
VLRFRHTVSKFQLKGHDGSDATACTRMINMTHTPATHACFDGYMLYESWAIGSSDVSC